MKPSDILRQMSGADGLPREALRAAAERRAEILPLFLEQIEGYLAADATERTKPGRCSSSSICSAIGERDRRTGRSHACCGVLPTRWAPFLATASPRRRTG